MENKFIFFSWLRLSRTKKAEVVCVAKGDHQWWPVFSARGSCNCRYDFFFLTRNDEPTSNPDFPCAGVIWVEVCGLKAEDSFEAWRCFAKGKLFCYKDWISRKKKHMCLLSQNHDILGDRPFFCGFDEALQKNAHEISVNSWGELRYGLHWNVFLKNLSQPLESSIGNRGCFMVFCAHPCVTRST